MVVGNRVAVVGESLGNACFERKKIITLKHISPVFYTLFKNLAVHV